MTHNPPTTSLTFDDGYRTLLGEHAWQRLHPDIKIRFSSKRKILYTGVMKHVQLSFAGKLFAHACRVIGTPLALYPGKNVPITVRVSPDNKLDGLTWDRCYHFPRGDNTVRSTKCIRKDIGLMECAGAGFGMNLRLTEQDGAIVFTSTRFFWQCGKYRFPLPNLASPGKVTVKQTALGNQNFRFQLWIKHPILGQTFYQDGEFSEA